MRGLWSAGCLVALLGMGLTACSPQKMMLPNRPPETTLFVQGPVDTVNHVVHLYWFGSDPDGSVVDFEIRFLNPQAPADTQWTPTSRRAENGALELLTDSLFTVFSPEGVTAPLFEVRAVDNDGARDATPARETFVFTNEPPSVTLSNPPGLTDTTFASLTLRWLAVDPDGDLGKAMYRVWLDGNQANPTFTNTTTFTVPTEQFLDNGQVRAGLRSVFVQAIDDGGRAGNIDSTRWFVRKPVAGDRARLLLIDDVPTTNAANRPTDALYSDAAARNLAAGEYTILRLQSSQPFRSAKDVEQTFALFDAVIWYRGTQTTFSTILRDYQDGIGAYLDRGGKFFIEAMDLTDNLNRFGPLSEAFASRYMGTDFFFKYFSQSLGDSSSGWGNFNGSIFRSSVFQDSLNAATLPVPGIRALAVRDTNFVAVWAPPGQLSPANPSRYAIGVDVPQPSGGRLIAFTFPTVAANRFQNVPRILDKIFAQMGVGGP